MGDDDRFMARWSKRKQRARTPRDKSVAGTAPTEATTADATDAKEGPQAEEDAASELPDISSLDDSSDFTVFMQESVPEAIRRQALRKLWRVNPVLANLDGLNNYDEDYRSIMALVGPVKTAYRVGLGWAVGVGDNPAETEADAAPGEVANPAIQNPPEVAAEPCVPDRKIREEGGAAKTNKPANEDRDNGGQIENRRTTPSPLRPTSKAGSRTACARRWGDWSR